MSHIFSDVALKYHESGYNIIPLRPNTKIPVLTNWSEWCETKQNSFQVESWTHIYSAHNIGIPLGKASGIIALDFDENIEGLQERVQELLSGSPVKKRGSKGFTAFYQYNGELPKKWYKDGRAVVELLSTGNQTVMPPSIHPDTKKPYIWITPDSLLDIKASELPKLPKNFITEVNKLFGYTEKLSNYSNSLSSELPEIKEIEKALSFIPSDEYATWITVGMALHHSYQEAGFNSWDDWSRKAFNYDSKIMQSKWNSFGKSNNPVSIGTIFHFAVGHGYIIPNPEPLFDGVPIINYGKTKTPASSVSDRGKPSMVDDKNHIIINSNNQANFPQHLLNNIPGLPGEIAQWINSTAIKRQPILALGAAICAAGTIFAHRIRSDSNARTNFMILGIAPSGCGKEHATQCINSLFAACNLDHYNLGEFASDAGMLTALQNNNGVGLAMIDELGRELKSLNSKYAGGYEARILTAMMKMFSRAGTIYRGKEYANHDGKMSRKDIVQPCLNIYGTTVPKRFYDSLTSDDAIDGFLARWLVFESNDIDPIEQQNGDIEAPPETLINNINSITSVKEYKPQRPGHLLESIPNPRVIRYTEGAETVLKNLSLLCSESRIIELKKDSGLDAIWARTKEHAIKLALVCHSYNQGEIDASTMQWAAELATYLSTIAISAISENVSNSEYERNSNKIYGIIKRYYERHNEPMKHWRLSSAVRDINQQDCNRILSHLAQSERILVTEIIYKGNKSYSYQPL